MDPVTQCVLGAAAAGVLAHKGDVSRGRFTSVLIVGGLAGIAADADSLSLIFGDVFLYLQYHRQFTHSLAFIPIGALLIALACYGLYFRRKQSLSFARLYYYSFIGYATHGLLDCTTSYGTQLLWPFSDIRISWNIIGVIDPLFTIVSLLLVIFSARLATKRLAGVAIAWMLVYLSLGWVQHQRALTGLEALAAQRGHRPESRLAIPTLGTNLLVWRSVYRANNRYYMNAIRTGWAITYWSGVSARAYRSEADFQWLNPRSQQAQDIATFERFSEGFLAHDPRQANVLVDLRYAKIPNEMTPIWGIRISPKKDPDAHADYFIDRRNPKQTVLQIWTFLTTSGKPIKP